MQTKNSKPTPRVNNDPGIAHDAGCATRINSVCECDCGKFNPERFDEVTGGYSDYDHNRAAKRISADMRKMDATPRQWHYSEPVASHRKPFVYDQNGNLVANFDGWVGRSYEENVANAKLGAAAPDLLASLMDAMQYLDQAMIGETECGRELRTGRLRAARAAIARATEGGQ